MARTGEDLEEKSEERWDKTGLGTGDEGHDRTQKMTQSGTQITDKKQKQ
jgi:hypothetical protein